MKDLKFAGCIFDMDGVVFDTERIWKDGDRLADEKFGVDLSAFRSGWCGKKEAAIRAELKEMLPNLDTDAYRDFIGNYVRETIAREGVKIKAGFLPLVALLKQKGVKLALATSAIPDRVKLCFEKHGLKTESIFDAVVTAADVTRGKPDPEVFLKAAERLGLPNSACCVLEDAPSGIEAAYRAGSAPIMVIDLIEPDERIRAMCRSVETSLFGVMRFFEDGNESKECISAAE